MIRLWRSFFAWFGVFNYGFGWWSLAEGHHAKALVWALIAGASWFMALDDEVLVLV